MAVAVMSGRGQLELRFAAAATILGRKAPHRAAGGAADRAGQHHLSGRQQHRLPDDAMLRDQQNLTVITNGLYAALELSFAPEVTTIVVGGILRRRTSSLVDMLSPDMLRRLHIDVAFLSCRGFTFANGMMESDLREAQLKRASGHGRTTDGGPHRHLQIRPAVHGQLAPARRGGRTHHRRRTRAGCPRKIAGVGD
ncbi:MAG: hypothetical protein R3A10_10235 [Caldilineaceae bacterium]